ncbi:MAG: hypothetical protein ABR501_09655 [Pyrinomonadaceae bacterium]
MTRNQKIAVGCGVTGCLGLVLIVIIVIGLSAAGYLALPRLSNSNSNDNSNVNFSTNANDSSNSNDNSNSSTSSSTMSEDGKHKLVQAAGMTKDSALMEKVLRKLGFINGASVSDEYQQFLKDHPAWAMKNLQFIRSLSSPEAARSYVNAHIDD